MFRNYLCMLFTACLIFAMMGCSNGNTDPMGVIPSDYNLNSSQSSQVEGSSRVLWGMWQCSIDPASGKIDIVPLRTANFTANVTQLLEGQPGNLLIEDMDFTEFFTEGRLDCTITLKHPFTGLDMYHGFDVWGVFMHNGSTSLGYDGLVYSDGSADDEAMLLNPDHRYLR